MSEVVNFREETVSVLTAVPPVGTVPAEGLQEEINSVNEKMRELYLNQEGNKEYHEFLPEGWHFVLP